MEEKLISVIMTKEEMLKFFSNKIVEQGIMDCSEYNTIENLEDFGGNIDLTKDKDKILENICKDERVADVSFDDDLNINIVFYTDYCLYYYDNVDEIDLENKKNILSDFYYHCNSKVLEDGYITTRMLIESFCKAYTIDDDYKDKLNNILKEAIVETGFIDKYIEKDGNCFVTLNNKKEFENLLELRINDLEKQIEQQEEIE